MGVDQQERCRDHDNLQFTVRYITIILAKKDVRAWDIVPNLARPLLIVFACSPSCVAERQRRLRWNYAEAPDSIHDVAQEQNLLPYIIAINHCIELRRHFGRRCMPPITIGKQSLHAGPALVPAVQLAC